MTIFLLIVMALCLYLHFEDRKRPFSNGKNMDCWRYHDDDGDE